MNLVNCAMVGAFILSMPKRPEVDRLTDYYAKAMMTKPMQWFCRKSGKSKFTPKDIAAMKATAALKAADRNPYSWNMEFYEYPDGSGYEGRFTKCGICVLMKELGLYDPTPAPVPSGLHHERSGRRDRTLCGSTPLPPAGPTATAGTCAKAVAIRGLSSQEPPGTNVNDVAVDRTCRVDRYQNFILAFDGACSTCTSASAQNNLRSGQVYPSLFCVAKMLAGRCPDLRQTS